MTTIDPLIPLAFAAVVIAISCIVATGFLPPEPGYEFPSPRVAGMYALACVSGTVALTLGAIWLVVQGTWWPHVLLGVPGWVVSTAVAWWMYRVSRVRREKAEPRDG